MSEKRVIQVMMLPAASVVIAEEDYRELERLHQENEQLRGNLSLAEEWLANYAQEVEAMKHDIERLHTCASGEATEVERLRAALESIKAYPVGTFRPLQDECAIWRIANDALQPPTQDAPPPNRGIPQDGGGSPPQSGEQT